MFARLFRNTKSLFGRLHRDKKGAALVEYAILVAGIALISLVAVSILGHKVGDMYGAAAAILPGAHADTNGALQTGILVESRYDAATGRITLDTILTQDQYLVMGSVIMASVVLIIGNLIADLLLAIADPRITYD